MNTILHPVIWCSIMMLKSALSSRPKPRNRKFIFQVDGKNKISLAVHDELFICEAKQRVQLFFRKNIIFSAIFPHDFPGNKGVRIMSTIGIATKIGCLPRKWSVFFILAPLFMQIGCYSPQLDYEWGLYTRHLRGIMLDERGSELSQQGFIIARSYYSHFSRLLKTVHFIFHGQV